PAMRAMHAASSLASPEEVIAWRDAAAPEPTPPSDGPFIPLDPPGDADLAADTIEEVILRRGSSRRFTGDPIRLIDLATILDRATRGIPADFAPVNDLYLIVNAVDGVQTGGYFCDVARRRLEILQAGDF